MTQQDCVATGIPGMDELLFGGIRRGNIVVVEGSPGTGKSTFLAQFAYKGAHDLGEPALIIGFEPSISRISDIPREFGWTIPPESQLSILHVEPRIFVQDVLSGDGPISRTIEKSGVKRLIIDGLAPLREVLSRESEEAYRVSLNSFFERTRALGMTTMIGTESDGSVKSRATVEHYLADVVISLNRISKDSVTRRHLEILKSRGQQSVDGQHFFRITPKLGIKVFMRAHAHFDPDRLPVFTSERIPFGIVGFDEMIGGGVLRGSSTFIVGISGTGKTLAGIQFLHEGLKNNECGLLITDEPVEQVKRDAKQLGFDFDDAIQSGMLTIDHASPHGHDLDEHFSLVRERIDRQQIKRVVIDSLSSYEMVAPRESRVFLLALNGYLRNRGVTAVYCYESPELLGVSHVSEDLKASAIADNIVLMTYVEISTTLRRALTVPKTRGSQSSHQTREYLIKKGGITLLDDTTAGVERVPQLPLSCYYGVLARSPTRHSPIIDEHVASGKPMPKSRLPKAPKRSGKHGSEVTSTAT